MDINCKQNRKIASFRIKDTNKWYRLSECRLTLQGEVIVIAEKEQGTFVCAGVYKDSDAAIGGLISVGLSGESLLAIVDSMGWKV